MPAPEIKWGDPFLLMQGSGVWNVPGFPEGTFVKDINKVLDDVAKTEPQRISSMFLVDGKPVNVVLQRSKAILVFKLSEVNFRTTWITYEGKMVPHPEGGNGSFQASAKWKTPEDMSLIFGACVTWFDGTWRLEQGVLFANTPHRAGNLKLPFPNMYEDGRICLLSGRDRGYSLPSAPTLQELAPKCVEHFQNSVYNTELSFDYRVLQRFVQFNPASLEQYPVPENWPQLCRLVNNQTMEAICG